jgi:threonine dehydratase
VTHRTPVLTSVSLDRATGANVFVKAESFQRGGSFKLRGAYNRISSLSPQQLSRGVAAYSSGNHAQAVAIAAGLLGSSAVIVMPSDAPQEKLQATRSYGAEVLLYDRHHEDRERLGAELAAERGLTLVPPYEDPSVMAGQGTAALELIEDVGEIDLLIVPVGGGGLIAGSATAAKGLAPRVRVFGVEPSEGDDTKRSLESGARVSLSAVPATIADGLQATTPGALTFEVNRRLVDDVVLVTDRQILGAMRFLFERMKLVAEPSGAVGVAALIDGRIWCANKRVGVIVSGGNIAPERLARLLSASDKET